MMLRLFNAYVESASKSSLTAHRKRMTLGKESMGRRICRTLRPEMHCMHAGLR